ncbi:MAG: hypothetical protein NZM25_09735 [Leptospiraceae bacterium]|nr:hypothetical protein [Leptospiraceae bacterium]MDW8306439.1 hypothetical protein [Leptospiraceae bacterium]
MKKIGLPLAWKTKFHDWLSRLKESYNEIEEKVKSSPPWQRWEKYYKFWLQDFMLTGPTLIGYLWELWLKKAEDVRFALALQSFILFFLYLFLLVLTEFVGYIMESLQGVLYTRSLLALVYLGTGFYQFYRLRQGNPLLLLPWNKIQKYLQH